MTFALDEELAERALAAGNCCGDARTARRLVGKWHDARRCLSVVGLPVEEIRAAMRRSAYYRRALTDYVVQHRRRNMASVSISTAGVDASRLVWWAAARTAAKLRLAADTKYFEIVRDKIPRDSLRLATALVKGESILHPDTPWYDIVLRERTRCCINKARLYAVIKEMPTGYAVHVHSRDLLGDCGEMAERISDSTRRPVAVTLISEEPEYTVYRGPDIP